MKERNDNSLSEKGIPFQIAVGIKYIVLKNINFDTLKIEYEGDVTFDNTMQIEVKHKSSKQYLYTQHIDFLNTICNWCQSSFIYEKYILYTGAQISVKNELYTWNTKIKEEKYDLIKNISFDNSKKQSNKLLKLQEKILSTDNDRLLIILERMDILFAQPNIDNIITEIANSPILISKSVMNTEYRKRIVQDLIGDIYKDNITDSWCIPKDKFYHSLNTISQKYTDEITNDLDDLLDTNPADTDLDQYLNNKFSTQLKKIQAKDSEITDAIIDTWKTTTFLARRANNDFSFYDKTFKNYENGISKKMTQEKNLIEITHPEKEPLLRSLVYYRSMISKDFNTYKSLDNNYNFLRHGTMNKIVDDESTINSWIYD